MCLIQLVKWPIRHMPGFEKSVPGRSAPDPCVRKGQTMKKFNSVLILCAATVCLSSCALRNTGPCYGPGCPTFMMSKQAQPASQTSANSTPAKSGNNQDAEARDRASAKSQTDPGQ
jgi:hypothetical protein